MKAQIEFFVVMEIRVGNYRLINATALKRN
jgi:hypothetical protein